MKISLSCEPTHPSIDFRTLPEGERPVVFLGMSECDAIPRRIQYVEIKDEEVRIELDGRAVSSCIRISLNTLPDFLELVARAVRDYERDNMRDIADALSQADWSALS